MHIPERVDAAEEQARRAGFDHGSRHEVGRLLRVLAASRPGARVGESGTGYGAGSAWLLDGMDAASTLVTVDRDPVRAGAARRLLADDPRARVVTGDWRVLEQDGPFDLLFCDGGGKRDDPDAVVALLAPGGLLVLDDFAPSRGWPPLFDGRPDLLRLWYLEHPMLDAVEVQVAEDAAVVLASRRPAARPHREVRAPGGI